MQFNSKSNIQITAKLLDDLFLAMWKEGDTFSIFHGFGVNSRHLALCWQSEPTKEEREKFWQEFVANGCQSSFIPSKRTKSGLVCNGSEIAGECTLTARVDSPYSYSIPFGAPKTYKPDATICFKILYETDDGKKYSFCFDAREFVLA